MTIARIQNGQLEVGTSGWTASDLDDPEVARQWDEGRYEIVNGILKTMPAADFDHGEVVIDLLNAARTYFRDRGARARISTEVDLIVDEDDVLRVDGMLVTDQDVAAQKQVLVQLHRDTGRIGRVRVAPTLVIESVSLGHERHDRQTKRRLYAGFGIPNYWIVDAVRRTLDCLVLAEGDYREDASGRGEDIVRPSPFPGLAISLKELWQQ